MVVRLPTEAEWEYACRAGTQTKSWWGEAKEDGQDRLNWQGTEDGFQFTSPVDSFGKPGRNKFGLADMLGNVWEWCLDGFDKTQAHEECYKGNLGMWVFRGGSFHDALAACRCAHRGGDGAACSGSGIGFRVAVGVDLSGARKASTSRSVDDAWIKSVAALPAEQQVARVVAKLKELNPGYDGQETHKIENGAVTELFLDALSVKGLSPIGALRGLKMLTLVKPLAKFGKAPYSDLSPLAGLMLTQLDCSQSSVSELSPLRGMPLTDLRCVHSQVSDLSPLNGMQLTRLNVSNSIRITDLSPLAGMPLTCLDITVLRKVNDLSVLRGMALTDLRCMDTCLTNLALVRHMPLEMLDIRGCNIADLTPLKGKKLTQLECASTPVNDLSPLQGMPLRKLGILKTAVSDLSPLRGMPLEALSCEQTRVTDLTPLKGLPLKNLSCTFIPERDGAVLRSIKTLGTINNLPVAEFWKQVEAGEAPNLK